MDFGQFSKFRLEICFIIIHILLPLSGCAQESYTWKNVSIGGGGFVTGIITSKTEQDLIYIRTDVGGAYRWNNSESKWIPLLDWVSENELGFLGVESIAIDPVHPNKVYILAGTSYFNNGRTAILKSENYGETFATIDVTSSFKAHGNGMGRQSGEKLAIDPKNTNVLYCGSRANGLFKSTNTGSTWSRVASLAVTTTSNGNGISFIVLDSTGAGTSNSQIIIAGVSKTGANLYRSNDGGSTFSEISGAPTTLMPHRATLTRNGDLFITYANNAGPWDITGAGQIWKYNLSSGTWTNVTPSGFGGAFGGISADPENPARLVASSLNSYLIQDNNAYGDRIFLTNNGGQTWTDVVKNGFDLDPNGIAWVEGHAIHWAGSIEFDPFDTKKAWVVSGNGVFKTDDIDAPLNVWKFQAHGLEETVPLDMVSIPNGPLVSVIGDYDGFRHSDVNEYAPIHVPRMGTTTSLASASLHPHIMLRVGEKMFYSEDMGVTWSEKTKQGSKGSVSVNAYGNIFLHSPENTSTTYRSIDTGSTWSPVEGLSISGCRTVADPINPDKFYAYNSANGTLLRSTNGGISFSSAGSVGSGGSKVIRAVPGKEGDLWVPLNNGGLTRSKDSGNTFVKLTGVTHCAAVGFGKPAPGSNFPVSTYGAQWEVQLEFTDHSMKVIPGQESMTMLMNMEVLATDNL